MKLSESYRKEQLESSQGEQEEDREELPGKTEEEKKQGLLSVPAIIAPWASIYSASSVIPRKDKARNTITFAAAIAAVT